MKEALRRDGWLLAGLLLFLPPFKAWLTQAAGVELHYDEAQYWEWSRQLDWGYYSKGPLIAWLIALSEALSGHGEWQTRLFAWLAHGVWLILIYAFALEVWKQRSAARWAVVIALLTPLYFTLGLPMTTDILLLVFWTWGLWAAYRALIHEQTRAWYEMGMAVGLGALTKLSMGLLPALIGLAVLLVPRWRQQLKNAHLWGGLTVMLVLMSPMLWWNAGHDWVMLRHESGHVGHETWSLSRGLIFLAGQWLALSPVIATLLIYTLRRSPPDIGQRLLWWSGVVWTLFFTFKAASSNVQLNWPAPSYIGLLILFAGHIPDFSKIKRGLLYSGLALSVALMGVAYFPYAVGLGVQQDPFQTTRAWRAPVQALHAQMPEAEFILTSHYGLAGELAFYWPRPIHTYVAGTATRRYNQHDLWPGLDREAGRNGLWISDNTDRPPELVRAFKQCTELKPIPALAPDGSSLRTLYALHCENYQPIAWPKPSFY